MERIGPGRPRETSHVEIREIARALFAAQGYTRTSLTQIAAAAGISRTTLFSYFPAKSDLLWEKLDTGEARLHAYLRDAPPLPPMDTLMAAMVVLVGAAAGDHEGLRLRWRLVGEDPELRMVTAARTERLLIALAERLHELHPSLDAAMLGHVTAALSAVSERLIAQWAALDDPEEGIGAYLEAGLTPVAAALRPLLVAAG